MLEETETDETIEFFCHSFVIGDISMLGKEQPPPPPPPPLATRDGVEDIRLEAKAKDT